MALWFPGLADSAALGITWDRNPEPTVIGYRVHVGTEPGRYSSVYDVGNSTSFTLVGATEGQRYFFRVAAYAADTVGPLSDEVSAVAGSFTIRIGERRRIPSAAVACSWGEPASCGEVVAVARGLGLVSALTATPDERLLFIEDNQRVRVMVRGALLADTALEITHAGARLSHLALDPAFDRTRFVFVGETVSFSDGARALSIVRYRMVGNRLGEGARIIPDLPVPTNGEAVFTVAPSGRLYVAVPGEHESSQRPNPYAGFVLHFDADGRVPAESHHRSPILARGYARPTGLEWDVSAGRLWLSGDDPRWRSPVAYLEMSSRHNAEWPRDPKPLPELTSGADAFPARVDAMVVRRRETDDGLMIIVLGDGRLARATPGPHTGIHAMPISPPGGFGLPRALSAGRRGELYVAFASEAVGGLDSHAILRVVPLR